MNNYFVINSQSDFSNIPSNTKFLIINNTFYDKNTSFLDNLPIFLQEIHFNSDRYFFNSTLCSTDSNEIFQFYDDIWLNEYFIKIPFGCKIYKNNREIFNFDGSIVIYSSPNSMYYST